MRGAKWFAMLVAASAATSWGQTLSGYAQVDYVHSAQSVDQLNSADGQPLNQDRFMVRRARFKISDAWRFFEYAGELELNTVNGFQAAPRQVEVAVVWPPHPVAASAAPIADAGAIPVAAPTAASADAGVGPNSSEAKGATAADEHDSSDGGAGEALAETPVDAGALETPVAISAPAAAAPIAPPPFTVRLGAGIFLVPFGHDTYEVGHQERLFAEPSLLSNGFFPGQFDVGVRLSATWRNFGLTLAVQNGQPIGTASFPGVDPNSAKDFFGRITAGAGLTDHVRLEGGLSAMGGFGFHPGTLASKDVLLWRDFNEDGVVQLNEIQVIRGQAGTASESFARWGLGADVRLKVQLPIGQLEVFGEAAVANNLDRGVRPADPVDLGRDQRSVAALGGFTLELWEYGLIGVRVDQFISTLDAAQLAAGTLVRVQESFTHVSFAAAGRFTAPARLGRGRLLLDYTLKRDPLGRDATGRPASLNNDTLTVRVQLEI